MVGGPVVAQAGPRLGPEPLAQRQDKPRLADAGLTREQDRLALATPGEAPAIEQQGEFVLAPDERRRPARLVGLEAPLGPTLTRDPECGHGLREARQPERPQGLDL